jgi:hypothetical protein
VSGTRIPLAIATLTLEAANWLGGDLIADCAAGTAARVRRHVALLISGTLSRYLTVWYIKVRVSTAGLFVVWTAAEQGFEK